MAYAICIMDWEKGDGRFESFFLIQKGQRFIFGYTTAQLGRGKGGALRRFV